MVLYNIPIENLEERYSCQWNEWFPDMFIRLGIDFKTIYPEPINSKIENGSFLDVVGTNYFKSLQLAELCGLIYEQKIKSGDVIFFHDLWFPGIEQLFYIRDALNLDIKIVGCLHAGTYDPFDFLTKSGMGRWAKELEQSWFGEVDLIFVATEFHKNLLINTRKINLNKIKVTSFPLYIPIVLSDNGHRENIIVFPHRLDSEKQPEKFIKVSENLKKKYPDWSFYLTKNVCKTKSEYYALLTRAKVAVSFALQETWGIAQQEAMMAGCIPVVPDRLSYKEMYPPIFRYTDENEVEYMIEKFMLNYYEYTSITDSKFEHNRNRLTINNKSSISKMIYHIKELF